MKRYQARQNVVVNGESMAVWTVKTLPATAEVSVLVAAGALVEENDQGEFPDPVAAPYRCCGR